MAFGSNDLPPVSDRLWDSVAARICEQRKRAFRCITSDLGETHRLPTDPPRRLRVKLSHHMTDRAILNLGAWKRVRTYPPTPLRSRRWPETQRDVLSFVRSGSKWIASFDQCGIGLACARSPELGSGIWLINQLTGSNAFRTSPPSHPQSLRRPSA